MTFYAAGAVTSLAPQGMQLLKNRSLKTCDRRVVLSQPSRISSAGRDIETKPDRSITSPFGGRDDRPDSEDLGRLGSDDKQA